MTVWLSVRAAEHRELLSLKLKQAKTCAGAKPGRFDLGCPLRAGPKADGCPDFIQNWAKGKFRLGDFVGISIQMSGK